MEKILKKLKNYKAKELTIQAEHLDCDVKIHHPGQPDMHIQAGNYLIQMPDGRIYPANKNLFEYLFEKSEESNETE